MCEHLAAFEAELLRRGIAVTFRGQAWAHNCREWVYFNCFIDLAAVRARVRFADCVVDHVNDDPKSGEERGLVAGDGIGDSGLDRRASRSNAAAWADYAKIAPDATLGA